MNNSFLSKKRQINLEDFDVKKKIAQAKYNANNINNTRGIYGDGENDTDNMDVDLSGNNYYDFRASKYGVFSNDVDYLNKNPRLSKSLNVMNIKLPNNLPFALNSMKNDSLFNSREAFNYYDKQNTLRSEQSIPLSRSSIFNINETTYYDQKKTNKLRIKEKIKDRRNSKGITELIESLNDYDDLNESKRKNIIRIASKAPAINNFDKNSFVPVKNKIKQNTRIKPSEDIVNDVLKKISKFSANDDFVKKENVKNYVACVKSFQNDNKLIENGVDKFQQNIYKKAKNLDKEIKKNKVTEKNKKEINKSILNMSKNKSINKTSFEISKINNFGFDSINQIEEEKDNEEILSLNDASQLIIDQSDYNNSRMIIDENQDYPKTTKKKKIIQIPNENLVKKKTYSIGDISLFPNKKNEPKVNFINKNFNSQKKNNEIFASVNERKNKRNKANNSKLEDFDVEVDDEIISSDSDDGDKNMRRIEIDNYIAKELESANKKMENKYKKKIENAEAKIKNMEVLLQKSKDKEDIELAKVQNELDKALVQLVNLENENKNLEIENNDESKLNEIIINFKKAYLAEQLNVKKLQNERDLLIEKNNVIEFSKDQAIEKLQTIEEEYERYLNFNNKLLNEKETSNIIINNLKNKNAQLSDENNTLTELQSALKNANLVLESEVEEKEKIIKSNEEMIEKNQYTIEQNAILIKKLNDLLSESNIRISKLKNEMSINKSNEFNDETMQTLIEENTSIRQEIEKLQSRIIILDGNNKDLKNKKNKMEAIKETSNALWDLAITISEKLGFGDSIVQNKESVLNLIKKIESVVFTNQKKMDENKKNIIILTDQINELKEKISENSDTIDDLQDKLLVSNSSVVAIKMQLESSNNLLENLKEKNKALINSNLNIDLERQKFISDKNDMLEKIDELLLKIKNLEKFKENAEKKNIELNSKYSELLSEKNQAERMQDEFSAKNSSLEKQIENITFELSELVKKNKDEIEKLNNSCNEKILEAINKSDIIKTNASNIIKELLDYLKIDNSNRTGFDFNFEDQTKNIEYLKSVIINSILIKITSIENKDQLIEETDKAYKLLFGENNELKKKFEELTADFKITLEENENIKKQLDIANEEVVKLKKKIILLEEKINSLNSMQEQMESYKKKYEESQANALKIADNIVEFKSDVDIMSNHTETLNAFEDLKNTYNNNLQDAFKLKQSIESEIINNKELAQQNELLNNVVGYLTNIINGINSGVKFSDSYLSKGEEMTNFANSLISEYNNNKENIINLTKIITSLRSDSDKYKIEYNNYVNESELKYKNEIDGLSNLNSKLQSEKESFKIQFEKLFLNSENVNGQLEIINKELNLEITKIKSSFESEYKSVNAKLQNEITDRINLQENIKNISNVLNIKNAEHERLKLLATKLQGENDKLKNNFEKMELEYASVPKEIIFQINQKEDYNEYNYSKITNSNSFSYIIKFNPLSLRENNPKADALESVENDIIEPRVLMQTIEQQVEKQVLEANKKEDKPKKNPKGVLKAKDIAKKLAAEKEAKFNAQVNKIVEELNLTEEQARDMVSGIGNNLRSKRRNNNNF